MYQYLLLVLFITVTRLVSALTPREYELHNLQPTTLCCYVPVEKTSQFKKRRTDNKKRRTNNKKRRTNNKIDVQTTKRDVQTTKRDVQTTKRDVQTTKTITIHQMRTFDWLRDYHHFSLRQNTNIVK